MSSIRNKATRRTLSAVIWTNKCLTALVCAATCGGTRIEGAVVNGRLSKAQEDKAMHGMMPWLFSKCNEFEMIQQPALEAK